jgi:hypothetical protein
MHSARGFTIYFAMLVATLALSVGLVMYDLYSRQQQLSEVTTQSQYAIYAADSGAECGLYWDFKFNSVDPTDIDSSAFATSSDSTAHSEVATNGQALCNGQDIVAGTAPLGLAWTYNWNGVSSLSSTHATTTFWIMMNTASVVQPCAKVEVGKTGNPPRTLLVSHGYNTCTSGAVRLERTLQVSY